MVNEDTTRELEEDTNAHPRGVWRAAAIAALAAAFLWIPYVVPGIEELRVVGPNEGLPLSDVLRSTPRQGGATLAGALRRRSLVEQDDEALMRAAPLPEPVAVTPRPTRRRPERSQDGDREQAPLARVEPEEYEGLTREIEDPQHSMRPFYRQLARVARGRPVLARLGVYGTSTDGADRATSQLRSLLGRRFGEGGKGWVPVAPGWRYQRHQDVEWSQDHWRTFVVNRGDAPLDRYGFGGVLAVNRHRGAYSTIGTEEDGPSAAVSRFRVFYQAWPGGGPLRLSVDGGAPRVLDTHADVVEDRVEVIDVPDGAHELTLHAVGEEAGEGEEDLRLYGVTMEREGPGVVVDGLALIGAFTRVLRLFDEAHLTTQVQQRDPDLLVFWMGANDAASRSMPFIREQYVEHYRGILRRYQDANPDMACMVMAILDAGERVQGRIRTLPRVPGVVEAQREVALAEGCAFFDTYEAMGGAGTMRRWYTSRPRLVTADLGHLTANGSRVVGTLLYRALMKGFDDWIADGEPAPEER